MTAPHGTMSRYTNERCRCDECRAAKAEYERRRRAASKSPTPAAEGPREPGYVTYRPHFHDLPDGSLLMHGHEEGEEEHHHGVDVLGWGPPEDEPHDHGLEDLPETAPHEVPEEEALFAQLQKAQEQLALVSRQRAYWQERAYAAEDKLAEDKPKAEDKARATTAYRPGRGNAKPTAPGKKVAEPVETKPPQPKEPEPQRRSGTLAAPFIGRLHTHELPGGQVVRHSHPDARAGHTHTTSAFNLRRQHG